MIVRVANNDSESTALATLLLHLWSADIEPELM